MFISYITVRDSFIHTYVVSQEVTYVTATMNTTCSVCDMMSVINVCYPVLFMCVGNAVCGSNLTRRCSSDGRGGRNCLRERRYISWTQRAFRVSKTGLKHIDLTTIMDLLGSMAFLEDTHDSCGVFFVNVLINEAILNRITISFISDPQSLV